jgi:23S rRNA pseudouridine1911/1915/1917 synthase
MPETASQEAREIIRIAVPPGKKKQRIDSFLTHQIQNATRNKVQSAISQGLVLVNGNRVKPSYRLSPSDIIEATLPRPPKPDVVPEDIPLQVVYEDDQILVINKSAGMVTHPAYRNYSGTLVNALLYYTGQLSRVNEELRPGIVHRLDKDTSGLMVVAKNDHAHSFLARQFSRRTIEREYWAVVWGKFKAQKGLIEAKLGRSKKDRRKVAVTSNGKPAATEYSVIREFEFLTLLRLKLRTGRTHQIRVHLAHIGHPVFGDPTYGGRSSDWGGLDRKKSQHAANLLQLINHQALHAKTIGFVHPTTGTMMRFDSDLPADMNALVERLKG